MCEETGRPGDMMLQYFFARAKGGTGLLTTGLVPVSHGIDATVTELGKLSYFPRIDRSRTVYCGWRDLAQGVHAFGSKIFIQLTAGLGRVGNPQCLLTQAKFPKSASFLPNFYISAIPCIGCQEGCLNEFVEAGHPQCAVNPRSSFESQLPEIPAPAAVKKKIAVVGGGPGGVIAAATAARRGHQVHLYEKTGKIGGRIVAGSVAAIKFDVGNYREYLERLVESKRGCCKPDFQN